jgi:ribosome-binding protein aMBF1 (putative translation factor)
MNRIEFERRKRGWQQTLLAAKVGRTQAVIACAEGGEVCDETLQRLAQVLAVFPPRVLLREVRIIPEPEEVRR